VEAVPNEGPVFIIVRFRRFALLALMCGAAAFAQTATLTPSTTTLLSGGGTISFTASVSYAVTPTTLGWTVNVPSGWSYVAGTGEPAITPVVGSTTPLEWGYISMPSSPVTFAFTVSYPAGTTAATVTFSVVIFQPGLVDGKGSPISSITLNPPALTFAASSSGGGAGGGSSGGGGGSSSGGGSSGGGSGGGGSTGSVPVITTQPLSQTVNVGANVTLSVSASFSSTLTYLWRKDGIPIYTSTGPTLTLTNVQITDAGGYYLVVSSATSSATSATAVLTVATPPTILTQPTSPTSTSAGSAVVLTASAVAPAGASPPTYQWRRDGSDLTGANSATLSLGNLQPQNAGIYTAVVTAGGTATTAPVIVGVTTTSEVIGAGTIVLTHQQHPNSNYYDQVLLTGAAEAVTTPGYVVRTSYIDGNDDIVQVEFAGHGTLSLVLDNQSAPALPVNYNQAVPYMKGRAGIVITGADETSNLSVFTVGRATAVNQTLFKSDVAYDGIADIAYVAILSTNGKFGGLRTADVRYSAGIGLTGVYAPGVQFAGPVFVGNISASGVASPVLVVGSTSDARITGGDLLQANGQPVQVSGITQLQFTAGQDSQGNILPAQTNKAVLQQSGADVTAAIVVGPGS
jgi:hypothetical protein